MSPYCVKNKFQERLNESGTKRQNSYYGEVSSAV